MFTSGSSALWWPRTAKRNYSIFSFSFYFITLLYFYFLFYFLIKKKHSKKSKKKVRKVKKKNNKCDSLIGCVWNLPIQKLEIPAARLWMLRTLSLRPQLRFTKFWKRRGNGAVEVSFESTRAQMSALFHIFTCVYSSDAIGPIRTRPYFAKLIDRCVKLSRVRTDDISGTNFRPGQTKSR